MANFRLPQFGNNLHFFSWIPEFLTLGRRRICAQVRLLGLAVLVGVVAGMGAVVFHIATRVVEHYALGEVAGYYPQPQPAGETVHAWLPPTDKPCALGCCC